MGQPYVCTLGGWVNGTTIRLYCRRLGEWDNPVDTTREYIKLWFVCVNIVLISCPEGSGGSRRGDFALGRISDICHRKFGLLLWQLLGNNFFDKKNFTLKPGSTKFPGAHLTHV